jgi:uncharacterized OsmC-like protein
LPGKWIFEVGIVAETIPNALRRVRAIFERRPASAKHADATAIARWDHDLRVISMDGNGTTIVTDMPTELGGTGDQVTPGWLMRAGLAACLATRIAMEAAERGVLLKHLEVNADSRSDLRGLLRMTDELGQPVSPAPVQVQLTVRASAENLSDDLLRAMIQDCHRASPVAAAIESNIPIVLQIDLQ